MGVPAWVQNTYQQQRPYMEALGKYVSGSLRTYCEANDFTFKERLKSPESISEKLEGGRSKSWAAIDDLVATTIVVPNLEFEDAVIADLDSMFDRTVVRTRATAQTPPDVFRFNSARWYGRTRTDPAPPIPVESQAMTFEVQVQTAMEHAWLIATHDTTYKGDSIDWQHLRLAASAKASVEQVDLMIANFISTAATIPKAPHTETDTKAVVIYSFKALAEGGLLNPSVQPESWSRFAGNVWDLVGRSKRGQEQPKVVLELVEQMCDAIREETFRVGLSGSLFQAVIAFTNSHDPDLLKKAYIVPSNELADVYGLPAIGRPVAGPN